MFCWLCVKDADEGEPLFSKDGVQTEIFKIAALYFHYQLEVDMGMTNKTHLKLCYNCWEHIRDFHEFQNDIFEAHARLAQQPLEHVDELLKTESDPDPDQQLTMEDPVAIDEQTHETHKRPKQKRRAKRHKKKDQDDTESADNADSCWDEEEFMECTKPKQRMTQQHDDFIAKHWKDKLSCELCAEGQCNTFGELYAHFRAHHGNVAAYVVCCQRKFFHRSYLVDHLQVHLNPEYFKCDECGKCFTNRRYFNDHRKHGHAVLERRYECEVCHKRFAKKSILKGHMDTHAQGSADFVCPECGKCFVLKSRYESHVRSVHAERIVCELCGKTIRDRYVLRRHLLEHQGVAKPKWPCDLCDAQLHSKYSLGRHKRVAHSDGSTCYVCGECGKVSMSVEALRSHKKHVHEKERKHQCTICGKAFKVPIILKEHMSTHTGVDLYQCPHCPKTFKVSANMHHHRKRVHPDEWAANRRRRLPATASIVDLKNIENEVVL